MFTRSIPPGDISWTYKANTSIGEQTNAAPFGERRRGRLPLPHRAQPVGGPVYRHLYQGRGDQRARPGHRWARVQFGGNTVSEGGLELPLARTHRTAAGTARTLPDLPRVVGTSARPIIRKPLHSTAPVSRQVSPAPQSTFTKAARPRVGAREPSLGIRPCRRSDPCPKPSRGCASPAQLTRHPRAGLPAGRLPGRHDARNR
jgi:hypothetical protein